MPASASPAAPWRREAPSAPWRREAVATLALAWPLILTNLSQAALNAINLVYIGTLGPDQLAAAAMATSLYHAVMIFCMGLVSATMPMLATILGRGRHVVREVRRTVRQGLWSAVLICLPVWLLLWQAEPILIAFGQRPDLAAVAGGYMHSLQWALLPYLGYLVLRSLLATMQRPRWTLLVAAFAILANAGAGWALIFGRLGLPAMGLTGAGISTTCSSLVLFAGMAIVLTRHPAFRRYRIFGRFWRPDWPRLRQMWRLGIPMAITFALETSIFYAAAMMMGRIGADALAAHAIAIQIVSLVFMVPLGLGQVATIRVGRARGAGDAAAVGRAGWCALAIAGAFMCTSALAMTLMPGPLVGLFLDRARPENAAAVALAILLLGYSALFMIADGGQAVCAGMLRGLHDTRVPMILAAIGYWGLGLPFGILLTFPLGLGPVGVWIGLTAGLAAVAMPMLVRWCRRNRLLGEA
ncbi:MATE family efflux transporter [Allostella humosa]|nr:MATE family efflux transporter [Stella humosa]BBK33182.1 MATE family efflux transporter [Stella humosa]